MKSEKIINEIIANIEKEGLNWFRSWTTNLRTSELYGINHFTQQKYKGANLFFCLLSMKNNKFSFNKWITFNQCKKLGGTIKKGSKCTTLFYFKYIYKCNKCKTTIYNKSDVCKCDEIIITEKYKKENWFSIPILKSFNVFNIEQTTLNHDYKLSELKEYDPKNDILLAEEIKQGYEKELTINYSDLENQPAYFPTGDYINLPSKVCFKDIKHFYSTLFHEIAHSTGHETRLNRNLKNSFGSESYAKEELIAELTSVLLNSYVGIKNEMIQDNSAYIKSWLKSLKNDKKYLFVCLNKAEKSFNFILERKIKLENKIVVEVKK